MSSSKLNAGILIVSDTAFRDPLSDETGALLSQVFAQQLGDMWADAEVEIVPDKLLNIQKAVTQWTDGPRPKSVVVTSGGTGFAVTDSTPEAISPLLQKHAPGLVHGMLAASLAVTPFALMSRPIAGVRHHTLILTLPGSPKGAKENLEAVVKLLPHACKQASGEDSRISHREGTKALEHEAGLGHSPPSASELASLDNIHQQHHHQHHSHPRDHTHGAHNIPMARTNNSQHQKSNNPSDGPTSRQRSSPYELISVTHALDVIAKNIPLPVPMKVAVQKELVGYVLADDVIATESVPAFNASIVDGYAVIAKPPEQDGINTLGVFPVAFASHAQAGIMPTLEPAQIARITTGAPLPPGSNAVVMVEDTRLTKATTDKNEEAEVEILTNDVKPGENVREIGSDVKVGEVLMRKGEGITAAGGEFGLLASVGIKEVQAYKKPVVGVLSTGDEIIPHDRPKPIEFGEVRDTNRPTLLAAIESHGFQAIDLGIARDKSFELESALRKSLATVDVLITSGGVSMGELDLLKPTIERSLGGKIHFGRVSMKPGKPTTFATIPSSSLKPPGTGRRGQGESQKIVFSLPGNPASAVVTFMLFVLPALHQMSGILPKGLPQIRVQLESDVQCDNSREEYHRAVVFTNHYMKAEANREDETLLRALSTGGQRSSRIGSFKGANALLKLPAGGGRISRGSLITALLMGPIRSLS